MNQDKLMTVLLAPHVSEKSTRVADKHRQYVFKVARSANKPSIKQAVELMFNVKVDAVRVCNVPGKIKRFGGTLGRRGDWKKAYVTLKTGFDINFMGAEA
jgi:large subunit ribosomal protein L23